MKNLFLIIFLLVTTIASAQALDSIREYLHVEYKPLNSDRPGATYTPLTVGKNILNTQLGADYGGKNKERLDIKSASLKALFELRYGIGNRFEIGSFNSWFTEELVDNPEFMTNSISHSINARYTIHTSDLHSIGALADVAYGKTDGIESMTYSLKALYSISLSPIFSFNSNLGYNTTEGDDWVNYTINFGATLFDDFGVFAEGYGNLSTQNEFWLDGGVWYLIGPNLQLDAFFVQGFNNDIREYSISIGATWRIIQPK